MAAVRTGARNLSFCLEPEQLLHLVPHRDAQVDAEREEPDHNYPKANARRATFARASLTSLTLCPMAAVFAVHGARIDHRRFGRLLSRGLGHPRKSKTCAPVACPILRVGGR